MTVQSPTAGSGCRNAVSPGVTLLGHQRSCDIDGSCVGFLAVTA